MNGNVWFLLWNPFGMRLCIDRMADADFDSPREICANLDLILIRCGAPKIQFGITDTSSYGDHRRNRFRKSDQMELVLPSCLWQNSTNNRFAGTFRVAGLSSALIIRFVHFVLLDRVSIQL